MTGSAAIPVTDTSVAPLSARSLNECLVPTARGDGPLHAADGVRLDHLAGGEAVGTRPVHELSCHMTPSAATASVPILGSARRPATIGRMAYDEVLAARIRDLIGP